MRTAHFFAALFATLIIILPDPSRAQDGIWRSATSQGVREASVTMGAGNYILVSCPLSWGGGSIYFLVGGKARYNGNILFTFDGGTPFELGVREGFFGSETHAEIDGYNRLISGLRTKSWINVRLETGENTTFPLNGSFRAIGDCPGGFGRRF